MGYTAGREFNIPEQITNIKKKGFPNCTEAAAGPLVSCKGILEPVSHWVIVNASVRPQVTHIDAEG